jgi:hypothetical protein
MRRQMKIQLKQILILALIPFLMNCTTLWVKPGSTESDFHREKLECEGQAMSLYPPVFQQRSPAYTTNCSNYRGIVTCNSNPQYDYTANYDINGFSRAFAWESCMRSKGWTVQQQ